MKVTLEAWAARHYSPPPSIWTLRRWVKRGEIHPAPELVGRTYYVEQDARRVLEYRPSLLERLKAA